MMAAKSAQKPELPKRSRGKRRELAPLPAVDGTEWGPCMKARIRQTPDVCARPAPIE
jgi:hypothetical protein